jgi:CAAX protease family protein
MSALDQPTPGSRPFAARIFLSPEERRLRAGWRISAQLILLFFSLILFSLLIVAIWLTQTDTIRMVLELGVALLAITGSVYLARRIFDHRSFVSLGLYLGKWTLRDLLTGIGVSGVIMGAVYLLEWAAGWLSFHGFSWKTQNPSSVLVEVIAGLLVFVIVGWQEELLSRGYWLQNLEQGLNLFWGVALSSLFFALAHLRNPHVSWAAVLGLLAGGIFLAYGYVRTRLLWLPIGLHIGWNFFEGTIFGFPVSGLGNIPRLINQQVQGPDLITGGAFGPEAGLIILPALVIGAVLVYFYTKGRKTERSG